MALFNKYGNVSTQALLAGGIGVGGYILSKPVAHALGSVGDNVARGYDPQDNGVFGITDILDKYSSPFVSRYAPDFGDGISANKQIYDSDLDGWDSTSSAIFDGYMHHGDVLAHARAGLVIAPHMASAATSVASNVIQFEALRKSYYLAQSLASSRLRGGDIGPLHAKSHLEMRVLGGMKFNTDSVTGHFISAADNLVGSTWNMIRNRFKPGTFSSPKNGSFLKQHFLYEGKDGFKAEVAKLAEFKSIGDIGFRDKFLFGRTFNAIDNLGISDSHANEIKQAIMRRVYQQGPTSKEFISSKVDLAESKVSGARARVRAMGEAVHSGVKGKGWKASDKTKDYIRFNKKNTTDLGRKYRRDMKNTILDGIENGKKAVAADAAGARTALDSTTISQKLSGSSLEKIAASGASSVARRRMMLRVGKGAGIIGLAMPIVTDLAIDLTRKAADTVHSFSQAYDRYSHANFGYDNYQMNEATKTDRQQAVEAIQNASLNARYLMGNEAAMYH